MAEVTIETWFEVLKRDHGNAEALAQIGQHYFFREQWVLAAAYFEAAHVIAASERLDLMRGLTANRRQDFDHARACFSRVLANNPAQLEAKAGLGNSYYLAGQWAEAVALYTEIAPQLPHQADVPACLAVCHRRLFAFDAAIVQYRKALAIDPTPSAYADLAWALFEQGAHEEAEVMYKSGLTRYPESNNLRYGYGFFLLHVGRWEEGLPLYELRWRTSKLGPRYQNIVGNLAQPCWDGKASLLGKTVMVVSEQGAGDLIQFVRYARELTALGARVEILAPPFMREVMETVPWCAGVHTRYEAIPPYDFYVPLMSCPLFFGLRPGAVPGVEEPYLRAPRPRARFSDKPTIGLVWGGDVKNEYEFYRSPGFAAYQPLIDAHPEWCFVALQVGPQLAQADAYVAAGKLVPASATIEDYSDTASALSAVDLLISSCTSPLHLAAAMGVPTYGLLSACPDWRWFGEARQSAWYPSLTLFRQATLGQWRETIDAVHAALLQRAW